MSESHIACLICESNELVQKGEYLEGNMLKCVDCGFVFTKNISTIEATSYVSADTEEEKLRGKMETNWYWKLSKKLVNGTLAFFGVGDTMKVRYVKI